MKLKRFELALALVMAVLFTYAAAVSHGQNKMADNLLRLHVVANSDSVHDQEIKLMVRDAVLEYCAPLLEGQEDRNNVREIILENMQGLANHAQTTLWKLGEEKTVTVRLAEEYYPTRDYNTFSLPAGKYLGLRVTIGEGVGRNWWCVVFPALCGEVAEAEDAEKPVGEIQRATRAAVRNEGAMAQTYTLRFKTAELIGELQHQLFS